MVRLHSPLPWEFSSAGRASALQAGGHRFEPCNSHQCGPVVQLVRMPACHAGGRRFEPVPDRQILFWERKLSLWRHSQAVRQRSAKPLFPGSNPGVASKTYGGYSQVVKTAGCGSVMRGFESHYPPHFLWKLNSVGVSPSGKATDSDSVMRRFESCYPSQKERRAKARLFCFLKKRSTAPLLVPRYFG